PNNWFVLWLTGRIRRFYKQFVLGLSVLQQAAALNTTHSALWIDLGACQEALGFVGPAEKSYRQASQIDRHCPEADRALLRLQSSGFSKRVRGWWRRLKKSFPKTLTWPASTACFTPRRKSKPPTFISWPAFPRPSASMEKSSWPPTTPCNRKCCRKWSPP